MNANFSPQATFGRFVIVDRGYDVRNWQGDTDKPSSES